MIQGMWTPLAEEVKKMDSTLESPESNAALLTT